jgi:Flp pilus assembly protein TadB
MSALDSGGRTRQEERARVSQPDEAPPSAAGQHRGHSRWLMIACCVPMVAIAIALVATGVVGAGLIVVAAVCVAMMALMMGAMSHGGEGGGTR